MEEEPEEERKAETQNEASDDGKIESRVFTVVDDVARKFPEAQWKLSAEKQKSTNHDEEAAEEEESAAEFAERIHKSIIEEGSSERRE
jgi:hypothetical protein